MDKTVIQEPDVEMTTVDPAKELLFARPGFLVRRLHQIHYALFFEDPCGNRFEVCHRVTV